jgi:hypothetical protein
LSLHVNLRYAHATRLQTYVAQNGQRNVNGRRSLHPFPTRRPTIHPTGYPLHQLRRTSHSYVEKSLPRGYRQPSQILPHRQLVPPHTPMRSHRQYAPAMSQKPSPFSVRVDGRLLFLRRYAHGATGHRSPRSPEALPQNVLEFPRSQWVVHWPFPQALSLHPPHHGGHRG